MFSIYYIYQTILPPAKFAAITAENSIYVLIPLVLLLLIAGTASFAFIYTPSWFIKQFNRFRDFIDHIRTKKYIDMENLESTIEKAGYLYDNKQDIFYSSLYPWQRKHGYCWLYDELTAPCSMIIDCEPIYFKYNNKKWLIELWKGQYGMTTGAEIGVYTTSGLELRIPGVFNGTFYDCAHDSDMLSMSYILKKNGRTLFSRSGRHWWLTGFVLGEFSEPSELTMEISINFKDREMRNAFLNALEEINYIEDKIHIYENTVSLLFDEPHNSQPLSRPLFEKSAQDRNKFLCLEYQNATSPYDTFPEQIKAIQDRAPELLLYIITMGRSRKLFEKNKKVRKVKKGYKKAKRK